MGKPPGAAHAGWLGKVLSPGVSSNVLGTEPDCTPRAARGGDWERRKNAHRQEAKRPLLLQSLYADGEW